VLADYFNSKMVFHDPTFEQIKTIFAARNFKVTEVTKSRLKYLKSCTPLFNAHGTAPGMWFEKGNLVLVSMPGSSI